MFYTVNAIYSSRIHIYVQVKELDYTMRNLRNYNISQLF